MFADEEARRAFRFCGADVICFQQCSYHPLGRYGMSADKLLVAGHQTAEILRPRPVDRRIHEYASDPSGPKFCAEWGTGHERVDLSLFKKSTVVRDRGNHPFDVAAGIETRIGYEQGKEDLFIAGVIAHRDSLALQVERRPNAFAANQLDTTYMA